jgi:AcrR family transcriptional regulator
MMSTSESSEKRAYHHGDLAAALLAAGVAEARHSGAHNLGVTFLARAVGVSPMAVYRHFANSESLRAGVSQLAREELARRLLAAAADQADVRSRFSALGRAYIAFSIDEPGLFTVAFLGCDEKPTRDDNPSAWLIFYGAIVDLRQAGLIEAAAVESVAAFAWSAVHGYAVLHGAGLTATSGSGAESISDLLARIWDGITRAARS